MWSTQLFLGLTITARPSYATGSSIYSTPFFLQRSTSVGFIGRDASLMSVSPPQNFLKPPPVPDIPTVTLVCPFSVGWNSSATASVMGYTVEEPSIFMRDAASELCAANIMLPISISPANFLFIFLVSFFFFILTLPPTGQVVRKK